jgi:4-hydroxybenzoate polyprenyltransferase
MATPAFGALLWLGALPPPGVTLIGLITAFSGYTAVYALNDVVDYPSDREKVESGCLGDVCGDLDAVLVRHPMAQGLLTYREGLLWALGWALVTLVGAYLLNPICAGIFLGGCILEALYCLLWRVSPLRTVVSGAVKTLGAVAAVFAVDASPSPLFLMVLFLCLFFWEIGGQNIPNDWADVEDDRAAGGRTVPVCLGPSVAGFFILLTLSMSVALSGLAFIVVPGGSGVYVILSVIGAGVFLMLLPAARLYRSHDGTQAMRLFNRASYYPPLLLGLAFLRIFWTA